MILLPKLSGIICQTDFELELFSFNTPHFLFLLFKIQSQALMIIGDIK
jgi:hypothetical protein